MRSKMADVSKERPKWHTFNKRAKVANIQLEGTNMAGIYQVGQMVNNQPINHKKKT